MECAPFNKSRVHTQFLGCAVLNRAFVSHSWYLCCFGRSHSTHMADEHTGSSPGQDASVDSSEQDTLHTFKHLCQANDGESITVLLSSAAGRTITSSQITGGLLLAAKVDAEDAVEAIRQHVSMANDSSSDDEDVVQNIIARNRAEAAAKRQRMALGAIVASGSSSDTGTSVDLTESADDAPLAVITNLAAKPGFEGVHDAVHALLEALLKAGVVGTA